MGGLMKEWKPLGMHYPVSVSVSVPGPLVRAVVEWLQTEYVLGTIRYEYLKNDNAGRRINPFASLYPCL